MKTALTVAQTKTHTLSAVKPAEEAGGNAAWGPEVASGKTGVTVGDK